MRAKLRREQPLGVDPCRAVAGLDADEDHRDRHVLADVAGQPGLQVRQRRQPGDGAARTQHDREEDGTSECKANQPSPACADRLDLAGRVNAAAPCAGARRLDGAAARLNEPLCSFECPASRGFILGARQYVSLLVGPGVQISLPSRTFPAGTVRRVPRLRRARRAGRGTRPPSRAWVAEQRPSKRTVQAPHGAGRAMRVEHAQQRDVQEEALRRALGLREVAVLEVAGHDARVVRSVQLRPVGLALNCSQRRTACDDGAPARPPSSATVSHPSRNSRSLTARHHALPGGDASSALSTPRAACQRMNDNAARRNGRWRGAGPSPAEHPRHQRRARRRIVARGRDLCRGRGERVCG